MLRYTPAILWLLVAVLPARAQQPGVELKLETTVLEPGEVVGVQLICSNVDKPETPQAVVPEGLELSLVNPNPSVFTQSTWINGRQSQSTQYTYQLELKAAKPGRYTLGPVSVVSGGKTYKSKPVVVMVRKPSKEQGTRGDRFIFVELQAEPRSLYVTESLDAKLTIGIRNVVINGRQIDMDLRRIIDGQRSELSVFGSGRFSQGSVRLADSSGRQHQYTVFQTTVSPRAEEVGTMTIGPIFIKADYPTEVRRSFFDYRVTRSRRETARADAITLDVKGPPTEGRPDSFVGAIGRFRMDVSAKPKRVEQGQPVTLTITMTGDPLEGVAAPNLAAHPELASRFDYSRDEIVGDIENGAKSFRIALFPKQQGAQTIPPISWSYFDPEAEKYITLTSDPVPLTVDPRSESTATITLGPTAVPEKDVPKLTLLKGGISPNYVDPDLVLADQSVTFGPAWTAGLLAPPAFWIFVALWARRRDKLRADSGFARRRKAERQAMTRLRQAQRDGEPTAQWREMAGALTGYLADHFNLPQGNFTPADARELLSRKGADEGTIREVTSFLETADLAQYAPSLLNSESAGQAAQKVRRWIRELERVN